MNHWAATLLLLLIANSACLGAPASPTIFSMANVLWHVVLRVTLTGLLLWQLSRRHEAEPPVRRLPRSRQALQRAF